MTDSTERHTRAGRDSQQGLCNLFLCDQCSVSRLSKSPAYLCASGQAWIKIEFSNGVAVPYQIGSKAGRLLGHRHRVTWRLFHETERPGTLGQGKVCEIQRVKRSKHSTGSQ